jgi:uncharacterized surface protein with fasciclin (FAS1) repeats
MNKKAKFGALLVALSLSAAACGDDATVDDAVAVADDAAEAVTDEVAPEEEAMEDDAMEDEAMEDEAMEDDAMEDDAMEDDAMEDEAMEEVGTIVDVASEAGSFTTLLAAAEAAGLVDTLSGDGPLADTDTLTSILTYHVVAGEVLSTDLADGMTAATVNGAEITVDLSDGVKIDEANVVTADIKASNGVIHVIDAVLLP